MEPVFVCYRFSNFEEQLEKKEKEKPRRSKRVNLLKVIKHSDFIKLNNKK